MANKERSLSELYAEDPERADYLVFGRVAHSDRRGFLKGAGLAAMGAAIGATIPFHRNMPAGLVPQALAAVEGFVIEGKDGLTVLGDRPVNAETPAHLLDDDITPIERHFIRNNGMVPTDVDPATWTLRVDGEVDNELELSIDDLKNQFEVVTYALQIECGGNGRSAFNPPARGNQWTVGAVGNSQWTGVRMRDVLMAAGVRDSFVYTGHYGADPHLSGDPEKDAISRGIPAYKAMDPYTLIAFEQNGGPIHLMNGAPLRVVAPGYPGSASQKWLTRIWARDQEHDGEKMGGMSYRVPGYTVEPGAEVPTEDMVVMGPMPVKSLITSPEDGLALPAGTTSVDVRGQAWVGEGFISRVDVSVDFGKTWHQADLHAPPNPFSWQRWTATLPLPGRGYYEVWSRATDSEGNQQPFAVSWNPRGYNNNTMHRIGLTVAA
ncbi:MAG: sulfite oxidase [Pseudomonadota bacterium]